MQSKAWTRCTSWWYPLSAPRGAHTCVFARAPVWLCVVIVIFPIGLAWSLDGAFECTLGWIHIQSQLWVDSDWLSRWVRIGFTWGTDLCQYFSSGIEINTFNSQSNNLLAREPSLRSTHSAYTEDLTNEKRQWNIRELERGKGIRYNPRCRRNECRRGFPKKPLKLWTPRRAVPHHRAQRPVWGTPHKWVSNQQKVNRIIVLGENLRMPDIVVPCNFFFLLLMSTRLTCKVFCMISSTTKWMQKNGCTP